MTLSSPVPLKPISAHYTCDGSNVPPPLTWTAAPPGTAELNLVIVNAKSGSDGKLFADWGVAGLKPSLRGITTGKLPAAAIVGRNSFGEARYSVCPARGASEIQVILLFALTKRSPVKPGFSASELAEKLLHTTVAEGNFGFSYQRP